MLTAYISDGIKLIYEVWKKRVPNLVTMIAIKPLNCHLWSLNHNMVDPKTSECKFWSPKGCQNCATPSLANAITAPPFMAVNHRRTKKARKFLLVPLGRVEALQWVTGRCLKLPQLNVLSVHLSRLDTNTTIGVTTIDNQLCVSKI